MFELGDSSTAMYHFSVLLDPLSEATQKWSSLVEVSCFDDLKFIAFMDFSGCQAFRVSPWSSTSIRGVCLRYVC
jgi:hypothetical protein